MTDQYPGTPDSSQPPIQPTSDQLNVIEEPRWNTPTNRRRLLWGGVAAISLAVVAGEIYWLTPEDSKEEAPTANPNTASPAPTAARTSAGTTRNQVPRRGGQHNEVVHELSGLEERAGREFAGSLQYFRVGATAAERQADSWHADALHAQQAAHFRHPKGAHTTTILEPSATLDANRPSRSALDAYFENMRQAGVADSDWGRAVVAPGFMSRVEASPTQFSHVVNTTTASLRRVFPRASTSLLLNVATAEWQQVSDNLRAPGTQPLNFEHIDAIGVEGFANDKPVQFDEQGRPDLYYLDESAIRLVVNTLANNTTTHRLWLSTGIPRHDRHQGITYTTEQRVAIAHGIANIVRRLQWRVEVDNIVLFAQNKLEGPDGEGRDFSVAPGEEEVLQTLADRLKSLGVPLSGYAAPPTS